MIAPQDSVVKIFEQHGREKSRPKNHMGSVGATSMSSAERAARISRRAYELAEQRGFYPGAELSDWLQAEAEIDAAPVRQTPPEGQFTG
jgi:hypothetical protein